MDETPTTENAADLHMDPDRLKVLKKNIEYLYADCFELTTLPLEVLIMQIFANAGQRGLPVKGNLLQNGNIMPDTASFHTMVDDYFARVTAGVQTMAEM